MSVLQELKFLTPSLPMPTNLSEERLREFVLSICISDAPPAEMHNYASSDFRRFVYTLGLASNLSGTALELGANPYFTTLLLKLFTPLDLRLANFFANELPSEGIQSVGYRDLASRAEASMDLPFQHFNIESARFPYPDESFDVVFFCEIIEHLTEDPIRVMNELRRILKPSGNLIVSTPNVARLENVARFVAGANIYDPYSGYGPYGRHNREYNRHELYHLLTFSGFQPEVAFTADVHANAAESFADLKKLWPLLSFRQNDLGQYLFFRARKLDQPGAAGRPAFLYRSYPASELTEWP
jgi:SAM-dependent methyltransferase